MYWVDNDSGVEVMPDIAPVYKETPTWFTAGDESVEPTYPGPDTFNIIIAEILNVLAAAGITPQKGSLTQLSEAVQQLSTQAVTQAIAPEVISSLAALKDGDVGSYAFLIFDSSSGAEFSGIDHGDVKPGSIFEYAGTIVSSGKVGVGSWLCMGSASNPTDRTLYLRIA